MQRHSEKRPIGAIRCAASMPYAASPRPIRWLRMGGPRFSAVPPSFWTQSTRAPLTAVWFCLDPFQHT